MRTVKRFLSCRRGAVALESALATIPLVFCLAGVFEIVQTLFAGDLLQRAAHRVVLNNAMERTAAKDLTAMENRVRQALETEIGDWLSYDLTMTAACPQPKEDEEKSYAEYCLSATVEVYKSPIDMATGMLSDQSDDVGYGGGSRDMVVVRLQLQPRSVLGEIQQTLFGEDGLRAVAVWRNEERTA